MGLVVFLFGMIVKILAWCVVVTAFVFVIALAYRGMDGLAGVAIEVEGKRVDIFTSRASVPG